MSTPLGEGSGHGRPRRDDHWDDDPTVEQSQARRDGGAPVAGSDGRDHTPPAHHTEPERVDPDLVRQEFGGIKWGSAFFGWLSATGAIVLLAAIVAGVGALVDENTNTDVAQLAQDPQSAGIVGGVALFVVLFVGYFCGGYVAGRMARFDGSRQGLAVWIWALVMAALFAALGYFLGDQFDVGSQLTGLPDIPVSQSDRTLTAVIVGASVLLTTLVGAILGGLTGMRFHRKVDAGPILH